MGRRERTARRLPPRRHRRTAAASASSPRSGWPTGSTWSPPTCAATGTPTWDEPWDIAHACRGPARDLRPARQLDRAQLRRPADDGGAAARPELVQRAVLLDPAIFIPPLCARRPRRRRPAGGVLRLRGRGDRRRASSAAGSRTRRARSSRRRSRVHALARRRRAHRATATRSDCVGDGVHASWRRRAPPFDTCGSRRSSSSVAVEDRERGQARALQARARRPAHVEVVPGGHSVLWDAFDETAAAIECVPRG